MKEQEALKSAKFSYYYAYKILKDRFEKGEDIISKDAQCSYKYALYVLKSRFEKGEDIISKDAHYSELYKKHVYDAEKELEKKLEKEIKELEDLRNSISINNLYRIEV